MVWDNEPLSSLTHLIGAVFSIVALVLLVVFAALYSDAWHVVSFSIFGSGLILLYLASTLFHFFDSRWKVKEVFMRIDHSMIYFLIAATYTPIALVPLRGSWGWSMFGVTWGIAMLGIVWKSVFGCKRKWIEVVSLFLYLIMGWLAVIFIVPILNTFSFWPLFWLFLGGIFYTLGTVFYLVDVIRGKICRWFSWHDIFHVFVLLGSFSHFWLMFRYVLFM